MRDEAPSEHAVAQARSTGPLQTGLRRFAGLRLYRLAVAARRGESSGKRLLCSPANVRMLVCGVAIVARRLMRSARHPHQRQLAGVMQRGDPGLIRAAGTGHAGGVDDTAAERKPRDPHGELLASRAWGRYAVGSLGHRRSSCCT
jgi:hypothetical protein